MFFVGRNKCYMCKVFDENGGQPNHFVSTLSDAVAIVIENEY